MDVNVKKSVPKMHAEEEQDCSIAEPPARHALVCQIDSHKPMRQVGSEKGKSGIAYVMNSGSLENETRLRRTAHGPGGPRQVGWP